MLVAFGFSFNASAQRELVMQLGSNGATPDSGTSARAVTNGATIFCFAPVGSAEKFATMTLRYVVNAGSAVFLTSTPVVSNDGVTWSNLFNQNTPTDSVSYTTNITGTSSRSRSFPVGFKYIGQRITVSGTSSNVTVTGRTFIK